MSDPNCIFCKIASGAIPAKRLGENVHALAFADLNPQAPTHVLVIPKVHLASHAAIAPDQWPHLSAMQELAQKLAKELGLDASGYRLVMNTGKDGGQTVFHLHLHLLGGRPMSWPPG